MAQSQRLRFKLMTYNIGGGRRDVGSDPKAILEVVSAILEVVSDVSPDILVIQEVPDYQNADGTWSNITDQIAQDGKFGRNYYSGPTLSMKEHMHVEKSIMVRGLFRDWQDWRQSNALFCRWGFARLSRVGREMRAGTVRLFLQRLISRISFTKNRTITYPRNIPIYRPPRYKGNRDTEPRYALLARVNRAPFPFVVGVHLTTLVGERDPHEPSGKTEQAQNLRTAQARRLLDLMQEHLLEPEELVFLLGDFNAVASEPCLASVLEAEGGFVRLQPNNVSPATHPEVADAIDHILVYPSNRLVEYQCWIVDSDTAHSASDHLPVVADVTVT